MAPLPDNATARVFLEYTSVGTQHTMEIRLGAGASSSTASVKAAAAANVLKQRMSNTDSFFAARFQDAGSTFSLPVAFTPINGVIDPAGGANYWQEDPESAMISFVGRGGSTGRRVRWEFFTPIATGTWPADNRFNPGDNAPVDTLRLNWTTFVNTSSTPGEQVVTIGGDIPAVYGYVNLSKNAYWQRKQR